MKLGKVLMLMAAMLLIFGAQAFGQANITKGTIEAGGSVGFGYTKLSTDGTDDEITITNINIMPRLNFFFSPKISGEGRLMLRYSKSKYSSSSTLSAAVQEDYDVSTTNMGILATVNYHFIGEGNTVPYLFAGLGIMTNGRGGTAEAADGTEETSMILPAVGGGVKLFAGDHIALRFEGMFEMVSNSGGIKDVDETDISFNGGLSWFFGGE